MIRGVLFDIGGTLHVNDSPPGREVWFTRRVIDRLADYGFSLSVTPEELAESMKVNAEEYKHSSGLDLKEQPPAKIWSQWYLRGLGLTEEDLQPMAEELSFLYDYERVRIMRRPNLQKTMVELKDMGLQLGIISNIISRSVVPHFLAEYGVDQYMDCIITSSETGIRKPDPGIFRVAEQALGLKPEELAYVGDTISRDIIGSKRSGFAKAIQICSKLTKEKDLGVRHEFEPDYQIEDIYDVYPLVKSLLEA